MIEFAHPGFLWALAALGVPIAVHLLQRRSATPADFPPAVLLEAGSAQAARSRRLRELALLAARLACLAAVVLCFARPTLPSASPAVAAGDRPARALVLVIDDSPSSSRPADPTAPGGPTRLARALQTGRGAIGALGPGSEAAAIFASGRSLGPGEPAAVAGALAAGAEPSARTDLAGALAASAEFLEAMRPLPGSVLVLSDCESGSLPAAPPAALFGRSQLAVVDLGAVGPGDDWGLLDARLAAPRLVAGEPAAMLARLSRAPAGAAKPPPPAAAARRVELVLDGLVAAWCDVKLEPGAAEDVALDFAVPAGTHVGELRLAGSDAWAGNDRLPVALTASPPPRAIVISDRRDLGGAAEAVRLALSAGPGSERKAFLAETLAAESVALADLSTAKAVILIGPPRLPPAAAERLGRAVSGGAGVVIFASDPAALEELALPLGLPAGAAERQPENLALPAALAPTAAGAALLAPFRRAAEAGCFRRALRLNTDGGTILARLRSPGAELAGIVERSFGRSTILEVASSPDRDWSDLTSRERSTLFVPLLHELTARAADLVDAGLVAEPGETLALTVSGRERGAGLWLVDESGMRSPVGSPDEGLVARFTAPDSPGTYRLVSEAEGVATVERAMAVRLPPAELAGLRGGSGRANAALPTLADSRGAADGAVDGGRHGREAGAWLAALALALLALELAAARLATRSAAETPGTAASPVLSAAESARRKRGRAEAGP